MPRLGFPEETGFQHQELLQVMTSEITGRKVGRQDVDEKVAAKWSQRWSLGVTPMSDPGSRHQTRTSVISTQGTGLECLHMNPASRCVRTYQGQSALASGLLGTQARKDRWRACSWHVEGQQRRAGGVAAERPSPCECGRITCSTIWSTLNLFHDFK